jgi:phosphoserine aminotransferase
MLTSACRKRGRNQSRIGMFPAIDPYDVGALTKWVDYVDERFYRSCRET